MFKNLFKVNALLILAFAGLITSCSDELDTTDVENYVIESTYEIQKNHMVGRPGCFELVFPVTIIFPDSTTAEASSYQNIKETIRSWRQANPDVEGRPHLEFPIEVLNQDGELISIADRTELRKLIRDCKRDFRHGPRDHHMMGKFRACFELVFPLDVLLPEGTLVEVESYREIKQTLREWRQDNPGSTDRPQLNFPIEIEHEDGSTETINSVEELKAAKEACRD